MFLRSHHIRSQQILCVIATMIAWGNVSLALAQSSDSARSAIRLKPTTTVSRTQVRLGDVADIIDNNPARRAELQNLDLAKFDQNSELTLDRSFIEIRIQLAGFERSTIAISGEEIVTITPPLPVTLTDLGIEELVHAKLCHQFAVLPEDLNVKLVTPFMTNAGLDPQRLQHPRIEVMPVSQLPLGRPQLTIRIFGNEQIAFARSATFEVTRRQNVVVAATSLDRSNQIDSENVREEVRFVDSHLDQLKASQLVGRRVSTPLRPGDIVTSRHVGEVVVEEEPILVQPREPVRLIAKKGRLVVTIPVAEALQAGRKGQLIRVRNIQSNQIVTGEVVGRGEVHVRLP
ncbi:flagellar basal body P-ring formation chaperone FlgA [Planctomicrobium sp. SH527]|uniref:flagellar basal body P-ring formation chaperone FlgA n=1 Tax=Planctomicrobium sp. SH527 TaxID=3448123 RepID=UPI003F5B1A16